MRLIAFLFLAAFTFAGVMRHSKAAAPEPAPALAPRAISPLIAAFGAAQAPAPLASLAASAPTPQVLRHKRRFAKAALRAIQKAPVPPKAAPPRQTAKLGKPPRR